MCQLLVDSHRLMKLQVTCYSTINQHILVNLNINYNIFICTPRFNLEVHTQLASTEGPVCVCTSMPPFVNKNSRLVRLWDIFPRLYHFES